jgi:OOP family OmpA-OmpF porin
MWSQRTLLGLVLGMTAAAAASAQSYGGVRWPGAGNGYMGLQAGRSDFRVPCGSIAFPCDSGGAALALYSNEKTARGVDLQVAYVEGSIADRTSGRGRRQGLNYNVVGKAAVAQDLGIYGRVGALVGRPGPALAPNPMPGAEGHGLAYGVGVSWDFSPRASASFGWDSYDFRSSGERDVRATSLGLQWRY